MEYKCLSGGELRSLKPYLKASTVSLSTNAFDKQFHWSLIHANNENVYLFLFLVYMQHVRPCLLLVLESTYINISLFCTFPILFIILYVIVNLIYFLLSCWFLQLSLCRLVYYYLYT